MELSHHFITTTLHKPDLDEVVKQIHLCGYSIDIDLEYSRNRRPTNHWTMFLEVSRSRSVKVDMNPGGGIDLLLGSIQLDSKDYDMSDRATKYITIAPECEFTVGDVITVMMENRRDQYTFTKEGEGCRYWMCTVVTDLAHAGKIPIESVTDVVRILRSYWASPSAETPRDMDAGIFF